MLTSARSGAVDATADLADPAAATQLLDDTQPDVIVNLVGLTDVDICELEPHQAYLTNTRTVENIAKWIHDSKRTTHLVHVSTDHVYDGAGPHREKNVTIRNFYAFSKYAAELAALQVPSTVLRTNFFGPSKCDSRISFTDWLYQALAAGKSLNVFSDVLFSPLSMKTLSRLVELVIRRRPRGVFNLGGREGMSKADFAFRFAGAVGLSTASLHRRSLDEAGLTAPRPRDMRMDCGFFEGFAELELPTVEAEILLVAGEYT